MFFAHRPSHIDRGSGWEHTICALRKLWTADSTRCLCSRAAIVNRGLYGTVENHKILGSKATCIRNFNISLLAYKVCQNNSSLLKKHCHWHVWIMRIPFIAVIIQHIQHWFSIWWVVNREEKVRHFWLFHALQFASHSTNDLAKISGRFEIKSLQISGTVRHGFPTKTSPEIRLCNSLIISNDNDQLPDLGKLIKFSAHKFVRLIS